MSIKEGDMVSIRQDFIDEYHKHEYNSKDIWEVKEVYNIGGGYYVAIINNLTGYGDAHICTYNLNLMTLHDLKMRENEIDRVQEAKEEGIRQGIWLCIQRLVHMEQYDMAKYFIKLFGFDRNECEMLLDKNGSDDKMESFIIQMVFNKDDKIILDDIGYHKIGSIFKYNIDSKEVELEVVESSDASCEGCAFNNSKNYYCKDTHCIDVDRKDDIDVIYKKVKRS